MSDQSPYSQYPQNPYSEDNRGQQGNPPSGEPYQSSIPPTQYAPQPSGEPYQQSVPPTEYAQQPYAGSPSPYSPMPNLQGMYEAQNPYAPQAPYQVAGAPIGQPQQTNGMAIAGLVVGIVGLFICW